ncbi:MAG: hypothetical protein JO257_30730 [Deltaproteobacteria bacterium]|nr:hypothetical protein [Deltaproteobacteria bacterium]
MIIAGGGIGGGAIDGVVNLYVIDDATRMPIQGASVRVGTVSGTTDATGLFIANGLTGPQEVVATASGYRSEYWVGANGANMTIDMQRGNPTVPQATLMGQITGFGALPLTANHAKVALVTYSQDDKVGDAANNLTTPNNGNVCIVATANTGCNFTLVARAGSIGLIAMIYDYDSKGTQTTADDTQTLIGYAVRTGVTVSDGVAQSNQDLTLIPAGSLTTATADFGTPPAGMTAALGLVGIELGDGSGVFQLPVLNATTTSNKVPALSYFSGAHYRFSAIAQDAAMAPNNQSVVLHRALTDASFSAGTWPAAPGAATVTRTSASWTAVPGAPLQGVEYTSGSTGVLSVTSLDGTASITIPPEITLPSGSLNAKVQGLLGSFDTSDLAVDRDRDKFVAAGIANLAVP